MNTNLNMLTNTASNNEPKLMPVTYDENESIDSFIRTYQEYADILRQLEELAIRQLALTLKGKVKDTYVERWTGQRPRTLREALNSLRDIARPTLRSIGDYGGLLNLRQGYKETVQEFSGKIPNRSENITRTRCTDSIASLHQRTARRHWRKDATQEPAQSPRGNDNS